MSDERDSAGATDDGSDSDVVEDTGGKTAVVTRPQRPTGKRARKAPVVDLDKVDAVADDDTDVTKDASKNGSKAKVKAKPKKKSSEGSRNPFLFVWTFLKQVVAELRKVIWPNRKQMVSYTIVVLVFLAFMVTLIGLVDLGLNRLITLVFG